MRKIEASIDKYAKEAVRIKNDEQSPALKRFKDASRALESVKAEVARQNLGPAMDVYLKHKTTEMEISKVLMKNVHVNKVNAVSVK